MMTLEGLRELCRSLPETTEDIKWGHHLVFSVGGKMYCMADVDPPFGVSFKTTPEEAALLSEQEGIKPAAYLARYHWVDVASLISVLSTSELRERIIQSHAIVRAKLSKRRVRKGGEKAASGERKPSGGTSGSARHTAKRPARRISR